MDRAARLNERFRLIQHTIEILHGKRLAFAAASAGWLMAIQYGTRSSLRSVQGFTALDAVAFAAAGEEVIRLDAEHEAMLQGFHRELCVYLMVDPAQAIELSKSFEQVVRDICYQGG